MENLTINGAHILAENSAYYKNIKRPTCKAKYLDRINFVCNQIILGNMYQHDDINNYEDVGISSRQLRFVLGERKVKPILNEMVELGLLKAINKKYCSEEYSKHLKSKYKKNIEPSCIKYGFTQKAKQMGLTNVNFQSGLIKEKVRLLRRRKLEKYLDNPIYRTIIENTFKIKFVGSLDLIKDMEEGSHKRKMRENFINKLVKLNEFDSLPSLDELVDLDAFNFSVSYKVNRVFHLYNQIPREYRLLLRHKDGSELWEVDKTSSQPALISLNFILDLIKGYKKEHNPHLESVGIADYYLTDIYALNPKWESDISTKDIINLERTTSTYSDEVEKQWTSTSTSTNSSDNINFYTSLEKLGINNVDYQILQDIFDGTFYQGVAEQGKREGDIEFYNLYKEDYSEFKKKVLGNGLYNRLIPIKHIMPAEKYLCQLYPTFMWYVRNQKYENSYTYIAYEAMKLEANIFIKQNYTNLPSEYFAEPVHDSIICKAEHVEFFKDRLVNIFRETFKDYFPSGLFTTKMLKTKRYLPCE